MVLLICTNEPILFIIYVYVHVFLFILLTFLAFIICHDMFGLVKDSMARASLSKTCDLSKNIHPQTAVEMWYSYWKYFITTQFIQIFNSKCCFQSSEKWKKKNEVRYIHKFGHMSTTSHWKSLLCRDSSTSSKITSIMIIIYNVIVH